MNWLVRRVVDAYRALARQVYARRYGTLARHLAQEQFEPNQEAGRRGFIVIQMDGLGYDHLVQAMARGAAPYIKRLIGAGRLRLAPWQCGLPSTTPAIQAGIMYGRNWDIPGFRWYDKKRRRAIVCKRPATAHAIQQRIGAGRRGILSGGSSYYNMYDGDAERSVFTLSALRTPSFFEGARGLGIMLLFLLSPLRVLRVVRLAIWNYLIAMGRRLMALFRPSVYHPFDLLSPMMAIFTRVLFQEIITFGVQLDIYRGARAIYLNNVTYDEVAHDVGPTDPAAFKAIKAIDRQVAQIDRMVARYGQGSYDLYILSDHGMSPSVPFKERFEQSLGDYIVSQIDEPLVLEEQWSSPGHALTQAQYLIGELHGLEGQLSPRSRTMVRAAREYLARRLPEDDTEEPDVETGDLRGDKHALQELSHWTVERHSDAAVRVSGPLAHVYFNVSDERLDLSDIAVLYPTLLTRLIEHPGIGLVVGHEGSKTVMLGRAGTLTKDNALEQLRGSNPLAGLSNPAAQAVRIHSVASFPSAGDLMLFGDWDNGSVVTFEDQIGTHGGLGGAQEKPFILYPAEMELPNESIDNPCDLYPIFARYRHPEREGQESEKGQSMAAPVPALAGDGISLHEEAANSPPA